jgi:hypothetical protein
MAYRPSSARRQQTSMNPITGEKVDYSKKAHFIKDRTTPMYIISIVSLLLLMIFILCVEFHH